MNTGNEQACYMMLESGGDYRYAAVIAEVCAKTKRPSCLSPQLKEEIEAMQRKMRGELDEAVACGVRHDPQHEEWIERNSRVGYDKVTRRVETRGRPCTQADARHRLELQPQIEAKRHAQRARRAIRAGGFHCAKLAVLPRGR